MFKVKLLPILDFPSQREAFINPKEILYWMERKTHPSFFTWMGCKRQTLLVQAEAEAKAQELIRKTISPEIVQLRAIEKWNGVLPYVSSDGAMMLSLPNVQGK